MKKGDTARIFQDPITRERFEGEAKLAKFISWNVINLEGDRQERWMVRFPKERHSVERGIVVDASGNQYAYRKIPE